MYFNSLLEDVLVHILNNANRFRTENSDILIRLDCDRDFAHIEILNYGHPIAENMLERIFDYGVSTGEEDEGHLGQGLYVARIYMAQMGGKIQAKNVTGGVSFHLWLPTRTIGGAVSL